VPAGVAAAIEACAAKRKCSGSMLRLRRLSEAEMMLSDDHVPCKSPPVELTLIRLLPRA